MMPMLGGFGAGIDGAHPTYRLAGKLQAIRTDVARLAGDDADLVEAAKRGLVVWNDGAWHLTPGAQQ
jgi:hypothetical protein